ncbi:MAG: Rrf2 family transcriptional regulator [Acidimicrobiia bacterium]|nr:Rrf2 family transcriptional regulator [Acidimicrobiia bacterium]MDX2467958.1 Rrf2 family transcriptional regulator [Acidimicrobiia bacterium]
MRLDLNKRTDLALRAMEELCVKESRVAGPVLAEALGTTRQYLPQILNPLVKARWVRSTPGPHGGYELLIPLEEISVLQLIEAMEGPTFDNTCVLNGNICPQNELCALHGAWQQARDALTTELGHMSLAEAWGSSCG